MKSDDVKEQNQKLGKTKRGGGKPTKEGLSRGALLEVKKRGGSWGWGKEGDCWGCAGPGRESKGKKCYLKGRDPLGEKG